MVACKDAPPTRVRKIERDCCTVVAIPLVGKIATACASRLKQRGAYQMFSPSPIQLMIVLIIALLLFGNRLPNVMRSLGKSVVEFKKGVNGIDEGVKGAMKEADSKSKERQSDDDSEA